MDQIDIGIEMWYQYWYRYWKICNDMQPYAGLILGLHQANETSLQSKTISHWLGTNLESAQYMFIIFFVGI